MNQAGGTSTLEISAKEYRYKKFTTRLLFRDLRFRNDTVKPGDRLPKFELFTTEGEKTTIEDLAEDKPVLLVFGSLTCPMTASAVPTLNELFREFCESVKFVMINVREAHPGEDYPQPETMEEKISHAKALLHQYESPWTIVSDDIDGNLHRNLDPKPNSAILVDANGNIVFRSLWASDREALHQALKSVANGEKPVKSESTALIGPVSRAMGHVQEVMERAGPQAVKDLWWGAFPMALAGRFAAVFSTLSPDQRGILAVVILSVLTLIILVSFGLWMMH